MIGLLYVYLLGVALMGILLAAAVSEHWDPEDEEFPAWAVFLCVTGCALLWPVTMVALLRFTRTL